MAGHSKYANIRHRKDAQDAKRSRIFSKLITEIGVAVRSGGPDATLNPRLRQALQNARDQNMPRDNIERAILRASGEGDSALRAVTFEGYAPHGVAIFVDAETDNNNRTVSAVRSRFNRHGGDLGVDGCLRFIFSRAGVFHLDVEGIDVDALTLSLIDLGLEDATVNGKTLTLLTALEGFHPVQSALAARSLAPTLARLERRPRTRQPVSAAEWATVSRLIEALVDCPDVRQVSHNARVDGLL
ncbi:MAG: YebC/PmpR family DNA-binding transcriptional regulator [Myxococcota bacterium]